MPTAATLSGPIRPRPTSCSRTRACSATSSKAISCGIFRTCRADGARRVLAADRQRLAVLRHPHGWAGAPYTVGFSYAGGAVGNAPGGANANATGNQNLTGSPSYAPRILINGDPGSGCSDDQYAQFNTSAFSVPVASASNPSLGLESGQNYMHGCFDKTIDLALARNFRLGGTRTLQFRLEAFNAFNAVVYNARNNTLQVTSPST